MRNILSLFAVVVLCAVSAVLAWQVRGCRYEPPDPVVRADTVFVERPILKRDTVTRWRPSTRIVYETVTDTVYVKVPVPDDMDVHGIVSPTPLRFEDGLFSDPEVKLTYWQPTALRYQQDIYGVPEPTWAAWADAGARYGVVGLYGDVRAGVTWRRVSVFGGYGFSRYGSGPVFGVRLRLLKLSW